MRASWTTPGQDANRRFGIPQAQRAVLRRGPEDVRVSLTARHSLILDAVSQDRRPRDRRPRPNPS
jgi:hypothetical protein